MPWAVLFSGVHPTLPEAEARALAHSIEPGAQWAMPAPRVGVLEDPGPWAEHLPRLAMAGAQGPLLAHAADDDAGWASIDEQLAGADVNGPIGVRAKRVGDRVGITGGDAERRVGAALQRLGVDLNTPAQWIHVWLSGGHVFVVAAAEEDHGFEARIAERRAHFSPIALHPRFARALVHLSEARPDSRIFDPFCGTGTIVMEAALAGFEAWGSDQDAFMVQGTLQALADAGPAPLPGAVFKGGVAAAFDQAPAPAAVVSDLPYGTASTTVGEGIGALYQRFLGAAADALPEGARMVLGTADPGLLQHPGWETVETHTHRVHRSLTRHFVVVKRAASLDEP